MVNQRDKIRFYRLSLHCIVRFSILTFLIPILLDGATWKSFKVIIAYITENYIGKILDLILHNFTWKNHLNIIHRFFNKSTVILA